MIVIKGVLLECKTKHISFVADDARFGSACAVVQSEQEVRHDYSSSMVALILSVGARIRSETLSSIDTPRYHE